MATGRNQCCFSYWFSILILVLVVFIHETSFSFSYSYFTSQKQVLVLDILVLVLVQLLKRLTCYAKTTLVQETQNTITLSYQHAIVALRTLAL